MIAVVVASSGLVCELKDPTHRVHTRYNIRLTLCLKDWRLPIKARGAMLEQTAGGVPLEMSGELVFEDGTSASMFCSFLVHETQLAVISGEKASIQVRRKGPPALEGDVDGKRES